MYVSLPRSDELKFIKHFNTFLAINIDRPGVRVFGFEKERM
jgi:hypothetical protein